MDRSTLSSIVVKAIRLVPQVRPYLSEQAREFVKASPSPVDISEINAVYHDAISQSLIDYMDGGPVAGSRNQFTRAMVEAFGDMFERGIVDAGGSLPFTGEALTWFNSRVGEESRHIAELFQQARELRKDKDVDAFAWASERADGYTHTLQSIYNAGAMFARGNQMLTWHLGATETHCDTCASLDGKSHRASWYISHNYIPRQPGAAMECGGYNCDCSLTDKSGDEVTL